MPRSCALRIGTFALELLFAICLLQIGVVDCQNRCPAGGVCEGHLPVDNTFHFDYLDQDIYRWAYKGGECVRLLTRHNRTGCATLSTGTQGTLRYVNNATELAALITENPSYFVAIVAPIQMLNRDVLSNITRGFSKIAGIVFVHETDYVAPPSLVDRPTGSSPDLVSPLNHLRPKSQRHLPPYPWNRGGDGLIFEEFRFAIIGLSEPDSQHVKSRAIWNNNLEKKGSFPPHAVEFVFPMQAKTNSIDCLKDNTCLPLGGHSVWSTFDSINRTEGAVKKPIVWGISGMDTTAFFHQRFARGADSNIAGLVAFLAAVHALSGIRQEILSLPNQIIFAAFDGETYDLVGSRKLVYDLTHLPFRCDLQMKASDKYSNGCWRPFMTSLDFTTVQFNKTFAVIELNQIGLSQPRTGDRTLFAHFEKFGNVSEMSRNRTQSIIDDMNNSAHVIESQRRMQFSLGRASNKTVGLPPSSTWSFIEADPEISGIVITDYSEEFNNKYYHSSFDTLRNPGLDHDLICMASTLFARTLYRLAAGEKYNESFAKSRINADCTNNIEYLLECLVNGVACDAVVDRFMTSTDSLQSLPVNSHYTGVYQVQEDFTITGTPKFVYQFLVNATRQDGPDISDFTTCTGNYPDCLPGSICGGDKKQDDGFHCIHSTTYYHPAVDTNLELNYDTKVWNILNRTASFIWTESNWPQIGTRFFQRESPTSAYLAVSSGLVLLILSCCFAWRATVYCNNKFKTL